MKPAPPRGADLLSIYQTLLQAHGRQHWWPAKTPFEVMVGAVLVQNTAWRNVELAIDNLRRAGLLYPAPLLDVEQSTLAELLRPSGFFNIKARRLKNLCQLLVKLGGVEPLAEISTMQLRQQLLQVNGIGPETADAILLYACQRPMFVIDAYTRRIFSRIGKITGDETYQQLADLFHTQLPCEVALFNEYHALVVAHAKRFCSAKPCCARCPLGPVCAYPEGG